VVTALEDFIRNHDTPATTPQSDTAPSSNTPPTTTAPVPPSPVAGTENTSAPAVSNHVSLVALTTAASAVDFLDTITVTWPVPTLPSSAISTARPGGPNDWVGLYPETAPNNAYSYYEWTASHPTGTAVFSAPSIPGNYVFRYFVNRTYNMMGSSKPFAIGPAYQLTPTIGENNQVKIQIQQTFGRQYANSWIGLYDPSKPNKEYAAYENVGDKKEILFCVPKAGIWEFRLFPLYRAYDHVASCKVDISGESKITLSVEGQEVILTYNISTLDPKRDNVWFGIYHSTENNPRYWRRKQTIADTSKGVRRMKVLQHAGTYEARLFAQGSTTVICRSNAITITIPAATPSM